MIRWTVLFLLLLSPKVYALKTYDLLCQARPKVCAEFTQQGWDLKSVINHLGEAFNEVSDESTFDVYLQEHVSDEELIRFFRRYVKMVAALPEGDVRFAYRLGAPLARAPETFEAISNLGQSNMKELAALLVPDPGRLDADEMIAFNFEQLLLQLTTVPSRIGVRLNEHLSWLKAVRQDNPRFYPFLESLTPDQWAELGQARESDIADEWGNLIIDFNAEFNLCNGRWKNQSGGQSEGGQRR